MACSCAEYGILTVPIGSDEVVILGAGGAVIAMVKFLVAVNNASVTCTVKLKLPVGVGFPEIRPVEELIVRFGIFPP